MEKYGNFWVPKMDTFGRKNRQKMLNLFGHKDGTIDPLKHAFEYLFNESPHLYSKEKIAIDAGANVGSYSRVLLQYFNNVIAFEPVRETFLCLERNMHEAQQFHRVELYNSAVSDRWEYVKIKKGWARLSMTASVAPGGDISAIPIDELQLKNVGFLKLDVEGYELKALVGAHNTIIESKPIIFMEVKPEEEENLSNPYEAHNYVLNCGYQIVQKLGRNWVYYPIQ